MTPVFYCENQNMTHVILMLFMQKAAVSLLLIRLTFPTIGVYTLSLELIPARFAVMYAPPL